MLLLELKDKNENNGKEVTNIGFKVGCRAEEIVNVWDWFRKQKVRFGGKNAPSGHFKMNVGELVF